MQQIERYGVIALLLVLVTVLGVSMWSSGDEDPEGAKRLAAETQRDLNAGEKPVEAPVRAPAVGPARRNPNRRSTPAATPVNTPVNTPATRSGAANLSRGSAPKSGDIPPAGRQTGGPGRASVTNTGLAPTTPVAGSTPNDPKRGQATNSSAVERERQARLQEQRLASVNTNRRSKKRPEASKNRVVADIDPAPGSKPARSMETTTNVPGQRRADYVPKNETERESLRPVSALVQPASTPPTSAREYVVRSGDTLSAIASRELGSAKLWPQIERANPKLNPKRLLVGTKILLPNLERTHSGEAVAALEAGARTYTVQSGDVLSKISQVTLGTSKRWTEIRDLNPKVNPDRLHVGTVLILPASAKAPVRSTVSSEPRVASNSPRRGKKGVVR